MCGQDPSLPIAWDSGSVCPLFGLKLKPGSTYRGPSLSRRGILGTGPIHPDQGNTFATHPTYITLEGEAEPFSLNVPVQKAMIPVISDLVPQYQQASTWEWELQFRTVTPLCLLAPPTSEVTTPG